MIVTGQDRRDMILYPAEPRPVSLPLDSEYALRADYYNANLRKICEAIGTTLFTGVACVEGSAQYGSSTTTYCRLTLPKDYVEIGDYLLIGEGTRQWHVLIAYDDQIEFSDTNLIDGSSGSTDYNTIKDNLSFMTVSKDKLLKTITKNEIVTGDFADALDGNSLRVIRTDAQTIKAKLDLFDTEHETDGTHSSGIIDNAMLDKASALTSQGYVNMVKNGAFWLTTLTGTSKDYWDEVGTPVSITPMLSGGGVFPRTYCEIATDDIDEGIRQLLERVENGVPIRLTFYAKGSAGTEKLKVMLNTDTANASTEIDLTTDFTAYYLTFTPDSSENAYVRFTSNQAAAQTMMIALVTVAFGDIHTRAERSTIDSVYDTVLSKDFYIETLIAGGDIQYAQWELLKDIKILRIDAYVQVAVDADVTIRLTEDTNNVDITIFNGNNAAYVASTQDYDDGDTMKLKVLNNAAGAGTKCTVVIQYRTR